MQSESTTIDDRGFFGHPKGLAVLFNAELWERFSFYGMRALLTLYMLKVLGFGQDSYLIYGAYGALVYACPVVGGWLANRYLGYTRAIVLGGSLMALGHFTLALPGKIAFFVALALLCVGNGFFKPNASSCVGRLYEDGDLRKERGFYIFYMGINIGALLAPWTCGPLGEGVGWHYGFSLAGLGMCLGLVIFLRGQKHIGAHGEPPAGVDLDKPVFLGLGIYKLIAVCAVLAVPLLALALYHSQIAQYAIQGISVAVVIALIVIAFRFTGLARTKIIALLMLMGFHMLFFAAFEQAGSSLNVLTDKFVDRNVMGIDIPASFFQGVNAGFIILLVPVFNVMWRKLDAVRLNPGVPVKFGLGLIQVGLGFAVLNHGIEAGRDSASIALIWLVLCYLLHTTGELCLSPVGLSAVTDLMPKQWVGFGMGAWFLTIANGHVLAGLIAGATSHSGSGEAPTGVQAMLQYQSVFDGIFYVTAGAGLFLFLLSPIINRLSGRTRAKA